jgi:hypothetical protein
VSRGDEDVMRKKKNRTRHKFREPANSSPSRGSDAKKFGLTKLVNSKNKISDFSSYLEG